MTCEFDRSCVGSNERCCQIYFDALFTQKVYFLVSVKLSVFKASDNFIKKNYERFLIVLDK